MTEEKKKHSEKAAEKPVEAEKELQEQKLEPAVEMVEICADELAQLKADLEKAQKQVCENLDGWQRERAEFSNYKKRIERDQAQMTQMITGSVIKKYLAIVDDMDLAMKNRPTKGDGAGWAEGIELIERKLQTILDSEGIERINQNKIQFDPNLHEAISHEENPEFESGEVIEVVRQGYKLGDRILRPAMVRVAR